MEDCYCYDCDLRIACMYVCMYVCKEEHMHMYICVSMCVYVCAYAYNGEGIKNVPSYSE